MRDLGTLPGDANSVANGINDAGDVVGVSLDAGFNPRAFLRRNGVMADLNTLIPAGSPLYLITSCSINSSGEIIGIAVEKSSGNIHGYLVTPRHGEDGSEELSPAPQVVTSPMVLPENSPNLLRWQLGIRRR
jgi:probable HAF family extracellular repeat protein